MEPVSTTAAAAVAAPAVSAAAPAAPAAGAGAASGGAGAPGAGTNTPAYGLKAGASPLDSQAVQPSAQFDSNAFQRVLGCHDGSATVPRNASPQTPSGVPEVADHWFNGPGQHGPVKIPEVEVPGSQLPRQLEALPGENIHEPSAAERAADAPRPVDTPNPAEPRPDQRAAAEPNTQPGTPGSSQNGPGQPQPEPGAQDFAQAPEPGSPPSTEAPPAEPKAANAATAPEPGRSLGGSGQPSSGPSTLATPPILGDKGDAFAKGALAGVFKNIADEMDDLGGWFFETFAIHGDKPGALEDYERATQDFRRASDEIAYHATEKDETFGTMGMASTTIVPEVVEPASKVKAGVAATVVVGKVVKEQVKKRINKRIKKQAKKAARKGFGIGVEKSAAYQKLQKAAKVWEKPVTESKGSWFQKWLTGKDYEYVGKLKSSKYGKDTVQIDDLIEAEDGKLVLVEAKFMKKTTEIPDSGHLMDPEEKINHLKRLVQFAKENPDTVSHIEITVSRAEAGELYLELMDKDPELASLIDDLIFIGEP